MKKIIFLFTISFLLASCFDEATFKLNDGQLVTVDQQDLKEYKIGQKVWLVRGGRTEVLNWEILSDFAIGEIGFEPERDTTFVFTSAAGPYIRQVALGTLVKKH